MRSNAVDTSKRIGLVPRGGHYPIKNKPDKLLIEELQVRLRKAIHYRLKGLVLKPYSLFYSNTIRILAEIRSRGIPLDEELGRLAQSFENSGDV